MNCLADQLGRVASEYRSHEAEALRLYELLGDADLGTIAEGSPAHTIIKNNPPSVGAVAVLIQLAQDKLDEQLALKRRQTGRDLARKRHAEQQADISDAEDEYDSRPELRGMKVAAAALELAAKYPSTTAETFEKKIIAWRKERGIARRRR